jgi:pilus assembly protein FimV
LAEAYIGSENRDALTALMGEMESAGEDQDDPARWFTMRQELARMRPASDTDDRSTAEGDASVFELLVAEPPVAQSPATQPSMTESESEEMTVDLDADDVDPLGTADFAETEDTSLGVSAGEVGPSRADELQEQMEELELDLRDLDMLGDLRADVPSVTAQPPAAAGVAAPTLELPAAEAAESPAPSERDLPMGLGDDLDLNLDALDELMSEDHRDAPLDSPISDPDMDSLSSEMMSSEWQTDSGLWDEAATKMDLARAYIEMADPDAARTILKEVLVEGNEEQQGEAKTLLATLD